METKKTCDLEYQKRALDFMEKAVGGQAVLLLLQSLADAFPDESRATNSSARATMATGATAC